MSDSAPLASALATYLERVGPELAPFDVTTTPDSALAGRDPDVVLLVGSRCWRTRRRIGRQTDLSSQLHGSSVGPGGELPTAFTIFDHWNPKSVGPRPESFDVLAIVTTYNETDIISQLLTRLTNDHVRVHVIDNWSTDGTFELVQQLASSGRVTFERFPAEGASGFFELERLLGRVEEVAAASGADWVVHHDADEIRQPPWPGVTLGDALWAIDHWGYNCIDHTIANFRPVADTWRPGDDLATSFEWFEFGDLPADFNQLKAWKPQSQPVSMANTGGHQIAFEGRRVFPYKFVTRHYPIRSQEHGERKILRERQPRWSPTEREKGWHVHYDHFDERSSFIWDRGTLLRWSELDSRYFLQRLTGVGLPGNPWPGEGPPPIET